jgi:glycosyltransferase involved in cell wall biosynthesis
LEILEGGKYGEIAPIGDAEGLGQAILKALDSPVDKDALRRRSLIFSAERSVNHYEKLLAGG